MLYGNDVNLAESSNENESDDSLRRNVLSLRDSGFEDLRIEPPVVVQETINNEYFPESYLYRLAKASPSFSR